MNKQIILTFLIYSLSSLIITYYFNLFASKNEYSKDEIKNILPQLLGMGEKIIDKYPPFNAAATGLLAAVIGGGIPTIFHSGLFNSAILPVIMFLVLPKAALYFEETRVTSSDNYVDALEEVIAKYYQIIIAGFMSGYATVIIYNWINLGIISFLWFIINFSIISMILIFILKKIIYD